MQMEMDAVKICCTVWLSLERSQVISETELDDWEGSMLLVFAWFGLHDPDLRSEAKAN